MWLTSSERSGEHHDPLVFSLACGRRLDRASVKPLNQKDPQPQGRGLNEGNCDALHAGETTHMTFMAIHLDLEMVPVFLQASP